MVIRRDADSERSDRLAVTQPMRPRAYAHTAAFSTGIASGYNRNVGMLSREGRKYMEAAPWVALWSNAVTSARNY